MSRTSTRDLLARVMEPEGESIEAWRADGLTLAEIAFRLRDRYDVKVSVETLRRWLAPAEAGDAA